MKTSSDINSFVLIIDELACGGAERAITNLANLLSERGFSVTLISFHPQNQPPFFWVSPKVKLILLGNSFWTTTPIERQTFIKQILSKLFGPIRLLACSLRLRQTIKVFLPNSVFISFLTFTNFKLILATLGTNAHTIISERNNPNEFIRPLHRLLRRLLYPLAHRLVVVAKSHENFFQKMMPNRISLIPNIVFPPKVTADSFKIKSPSILAMGRLIPEKGFDFLLEASREPLKENPQWHLNICGNGPERKNLETLTKQLELESQVHFLGEVRDTASVFAQSEIFVLSSRTEGFPNALAEAMSSGLASISTPCGEDADIIKPDSNGFIVEFGKKSALAEKLNKLMNDKNFRETFKLKSLEVRDRLGPEKVLNLWLDCMRRPRV